MGNGRTQDWNSARRKSIQWSEAVRELKGEETKVSSETQNFRDFLGETAVGSFQAQGWPG